MTSHFRMDLPSCGSLLGLRIDDEENGVGSSGSVIVMFTEDGDGTVSPTIILPDAEVEPIRTIVIEDEAPAL